MSLWGGRFSEKNDPLMQQFNASIGFDKRMWKEDLDGSKAYSKALQKVGILSPEELGQILNGLESVASEWRAGTFQLHESDEDIHTANERRLTELIGAVAGKLHTGRSRNDQVATDMRLWLRNHIDHLQTSLIGLISAVVGRAESEIHVLMPGYTHLQMAGFMMTLKGTPSTYNKDLQEDKEPMFDSFDNVKGCIEISTGVISTLKINEKKMADALSFDMLATDLAEYLVRKQVPFRETHHIAGRAVRLAEDKGCTLRDLSVADLKTLHPSFDDDVLQVWRYEFSVENRDVKGGTSKSAVEHQIKELRTLLAI
ncbi:argininosuccinate lyase [Phlyctochytrium bullatum]|nr:argininosuccinate lyase [Phlyctochytrium bullatum]